MRYTLKQKIGVLVLDWPKFEMKLWSPSAASPHPRWVEICNRKESLKSAPKGPGVLCQWKWASDLHATKVFPSLGLRLMKRAFKDWPIELLDSPEFGKTDIGISFIIGHRGIERLPHLLATVKSIAAQRDVSLECIVVEQSASREIETSLPSWVRYIHTPLPYPDMPYCRSWTFNVGARVAKGEILVFHDNDMLVPTNYAAHLMVRFAEGFEVANLKRFVFYMGKEHLKKILSAVKLNFSMSPAAIVQNLEGGGSLAVSKKAFFEIGCFDESFVGWGGEDSEFWDRAQTRKVWPYGYIPIVHLWHAPQQGKFDNKMTRKDLYWTLSKEPVESRIRRLLSITSGNISGPVTGE